MHCRPLRAYNMYSTYSIYLTSSYRHKLCTYPRASSPPHTGLFVLYLLCRSTYPLLLYISAAPSIISYRILEDRVTSSVEDMHTYIHKTVCGGLVQPQLGMINGRCVCSRHRLRHTFQLLDLLYTFPPTYLPTLTNQPTSYQPTNQPTNQPGPEYHV